MVIAVRQGSGNQGGSGEMFEDRAVGVIVGAAVGDALGAPYEFGAPGQLARRGKEMAGGGTLGWEPGEWTDDTQMAMHLAASLVARGGLDEPDIFARFGAWAASHPPDIGIQTSRVLFSGRPWDLAAREDFARSSQAAGNGSLMRTSPAAVFFARAGAQNSADAARRISALTHGDPVAGETCVVLHELIRRGLAGQDPRECVPQALELVSPEHRGQLAALLDPAWVPDGANNGVCWVTLAQAVWAVRTADGFAEALRRVINLGGDTDTVACVTGALAGATWGMQAIPSAWTTVVHGEVPGDPTPIAKDLESLQAMAFALWGSQPSPLATLGPGLPALQIAPHLFAADLVGARDAGDGFAIVSLCRTGGLVQPTRQVWLTDSEDPARNPQLGLVVADTLGQIELLRAEGRNVLVHCHRGASRTGLIIRAWLQQIEGLSYEAALARVTALRPEFTPWNRRFESFLLEFS